MKKTDDQKSRETVPLRYPKAFLNLIQFSHSYNTFQTTPRYSGNRGVATPRFPEYRGVATPRFPEYRGVAYLHNLKNSPVFGNRGVTTPRFPEYRGVARDSMIL